MRAGIIAVGSRGDVQPYIALGAGFRRAGHEVRLLTHVGLFAAAGYARLQCPEGQARRSAPVTAWVAYTFFE